jgi:Cu/Ag efflux pump CusA
VLVLAVALLVLGATQLRDLPVDVLPEFSPPTVEIQTEALGLSAAEVEQLITVPLEQDLLNGVAWLDTTRSESLPGLSRVELIFEPGTDLLRARQVVQERLTQAHALPRVSKPPQMLQPLSSTSRVMMVGLSSKELSLIELSVLARWTVRPRLMGVSGVANVAIWGQRERQLQVQADPERLAAARRALGIAAIAAVLVLLLLQAAFGSWRLAGAVFLTLPAALVGGLAAVLATGGTLSLGSLVGLVLVLAVAARNAVVLVSRCRRLARGPDAPTGAGLAMGAAAERLNPVLLTAVATTLALVPLVARGPVPGHELLQPMAVVVLGGLVTATLLNLFVTPALYLRFGSPSERRLDAAQ